MTTLSFLLSTKQSIFFQNNIFTVDLNLHNKSIKQTQNINISSRLIVTNYDKHEKEFDAKYIFFGRGFAFYNNPGNAAFRKRSVKRDIIQCLIAKAKEQGRRFLVCSLENGIWVEAHARLI
jgi:hypothetical protein